MNNSRLTFFISILALVIAFCSLGYTWWTTPDVAYIDTGRLLNEYQGMLDARAEYEQKASRWKANVDTLQQEVKVAIMNYEKEAPKLTEKEKQLTQELIRNKQKQFQQYQQAINQQSQQEDAAMTQQVLDKVNAFLEKYGEKKGYRFILGTGQGNLVYADEGYDLTEEVIEKLNKEYLGM